MIKFVGISHYDENYIIDEELQHLKIIDNTPIDYEPIIQKYTFGKNQIAYTTLICREKINETFIDYFSNIYPEIFEKQKSRNKFFNAISNYKSVTRDFIDKYIDDLNFFAILNCVDVDDDYIISKKWMIEKCHSTINLIFSYRLTYKISERVIKEFSDIIVAYYINSNIYNLFSDYKFRISFLKELVQHYNWKNIILYLISDLEHNGNIHSMFINKYSKGDIYIMLQQVKELCALDG